MASKGALGEYESRYYTSGDGLRLHYRDYPGPVDHPFAVVCLPGLTRNARDFEDLAPHLARGYRVLCMDFRGRGLSDRATDPFTYVPTQYVEDLERLLRDAGLQQVALVGTSLGGMVATVAAASFREAILGIVLNDVGPEVDPRGLARIAGYVGKTGVIETWQDAAEAVRSIDDVNYPGFTEQDWLRLARQRYREEGTSIRLDYDMDISKAFAAPVTSADPWVYFRQLQGIPLLLLRGALSDILAPTTVERMRSSVPTMRVADVPARGHVPLLDEPEALAAIDAFFAELRTAPEGQGGTQR